VVLTRRAIHKAAAARHLGVGWSTVQHHSRSLVRERQCREVPYQGLRFLVPARLPPQVASRAIVLAVAEHQKVLGRIIQGGGSGIQELARGLRWSRKVARRCLYALLEAGLVAKTAQYHPRFRATRVGRTEYRRVARADGA
jgi:hypothetical protein